MKILSKVMLVIGSFFLLSLSADASSATVSVKSNYSQILVGNTVTVTVTVSSSEALGSWKYSLNYNSTVFTLVSGNLTVAEPADNPNTKTKTYTYTFKAKNSGSGTFSIGSSNVANWDGNYLTTTTASKTVKVITQAELEASYSKNNNLKSLEVVGFELDQPFSSDVAEYNVSVPEGTELIELAATREDSKSSVSGTGELEVSYGLNKFEVVVTAQNGSTKTYIVNVTVEDKNPIEVNILDNVYTLLKDKRGLVAPATFVETTVSINGVEIPALYGELLDVTLVGVKDVDGNILLAKYDADNNKYELYVELSFVTFNVIPLAYDKEIEGYTLKEVKINDKLVNVYVKEDSDFYLIYGTNTVTGKNALYKYDSVEGTVQRYEETVGGSDELALYKTATAALGFITAASFISITVIGSRRKSRVKAINDNIFTDDYKASISETSDDDVFDLLNEKKSKKRK